MTTRTYQRGEAIVLEAESKNRKTGALENPVFGVKITITNPKEAVKVTLAAMTPVTTGIYEYYYLSLADDEPGWWKAKAKSLDGTVEVTIPTITDGGFQLVK